MAKSSKKTGRRREASPLPSDLEDEVDKYHKKRDILSLDAAQASDSDGDDSHEEEAVLDMSDPEFSGDESLEDSDEEGDRSAHLSKRAFSPGPCGTGSMRGRRCASPLHAPVRSVTNASP